MSKNIMFLCLKIKKMEENKHYTSPEHQPVSADDDELQIDWMGILRQILAIRKTLYKAAGIGLILGILIALGTPKQYTVSITLSPEMGSSKSGNGLASMAAFFSGGSVGADSPMPSMPPWLRTS